MKVLQIAELIERKAPTTLALDFDNVGLLVGDKDAEVTNVLTVVDVNRAAIEFAIDNKCNLIVAHHPIIFNAIKTVTKDDFIGELLLSAISANINIYAAHTNMDKSENGINFGLAKALNGTNIHSSFSDGIGVIFDINKSSLEDIIDKLDEIMCGGVIKSFENTRKLYTRIAFISGCGGRDESVIKYILKEGAQLFITCEFKNHIEVELKDRQISYIECNHSDSERIFEDIICNLLAETDTKVLRC